MLESKEQIPKMPYEGKPCVSNLFKKRIETAIDFASLSNNFAILDAGCKDGYLLKQISDKNFQCKCHGIDIKPIIPLLTKNCDISIVNICIIFKL